jgi:antitoxin CptB
MSSLARLQWQCRRGLKELDLLLLDYMTSEYLVADSIEKGLFIELLKLEDDKLVDSILDNRTIDRHDLIPVIEKIKARSLNSIQ